MRADPLNSSVRFSCFSSVAPRHRQDPSVMYFQLLKDILLHNTSDENEHEAKSDMLDEFAEHFRSALAIEWYTRECFLFRMLNKALRTPEPDVLYKLRFFLRCLHVQIASVGASQRQRSTPMVLHRAHSITPEKLDQLRVGVDDEDNPPPPTPQQHRIGLSHSVEVR